MNVSSINITYALNTHIYTPSHTLTPSHPHTLSAVLFREAVIFGLSHETAFTETSFSFKHSFPFATVERSVSGEGGEGGEGLKWFDMHVIVFVASRAFK